MSAISGNLRKMRSTLNEAVSYQLPMSEECVDMNALIGQTVNLKFDGQINSFGKNMLPKLTPN